MIIVTTDTIANQNIVEVKGLVTSSIVQSRNIGKDILSGLKSVIGGELKNYTQMLEENAARDRNIMLLLLCLTAGIVDVIGYLSIGHVFTANMTGNIVLLGLSIGNSLHATARGRREVLIRTKRKAGK